MSNETVRLAVDLRISDGKFGAFESVAQAMVAGSQAEAGTVTYSWYLSADRKRCRLIEVYPDSNAVIAHFSGPVVTDLVPKLLETAQLTDFEVYGDPNPEAAAILAGFGAEVFKPWQGFSR